jgi:hypothetical protein
MRFTKDVSNIQPILSTLPPASSLTREDGPYSNNRYVREAVLERQESQHVMWLYERTRMSGRGFGFTGGHYHWEWAHPDLRTAMLNAILWIAGIEIPEDGVPAPMLSIEDLEVNQDYEQPEDFKRDGIKRQVDEWQTER